MTTHPNESAFPIPGQRMEGLTKREYFAGLALQGILANSEHGHVSLEYHIEYAVKAADELITELNKRFESL